MLRRIARPPVDALLRRPYRRMASKKTVFVLEKDKTTKNQIRFSADRATQDPEIKMNGVDYDYGAMGGTLTLYLTKQFLTDANLTEDAPIKVTIEQQPISRKTRTSKHPADELV
ncbi:hypothetical protein M885DRAFT_561927 [Pelagophyceae sp. CCMP2097]|nr:hypothetical protein M885DRAFT_561927 [Pelagophyceae sp. CCMP2097]